jgi:hypothetical protein
MSPLLPPPPQLHLLARPGPDLAIGTLDFLLGPADGLHRTPLYAVLKLPSLDIRKPVHARSEWRASVASGILKI